MKKALSLLIVVIIAFLAVSCGKSETVVTHELKENIETVPYFKDGNMYYLKNGTSTLIAENIYDEESDDPLYTADYAIDRESGAILYISDGALYKNDGKNTKIAGNVASWRGGKGFEAIAYTTPWEENKGKETGVLYIVSHGEKISADVGVKTDSLMFSGDGKYLFALKPNTYPMPGYKVYKYALDGEKTLVSEQAAELMWVSFDGKCVITGNKNGEYYDYTVILDKKSTEIKKVYYPSVTDDGQVLYALVNFDGTSGILKKIDLKTLKQTELFKGVSFFSAEAVTNQSKGVVYSVLTDSENEYYSVYYSGKKDMRLMHNAKKDAIYSVAINSENNNGYVLTKSSGGVHSIDISGKTLKSTKLLSCHGDSLVYYEALDCATFIKNPESGAGELYKVKNGEVSLLCADCASSYNGSFYSAMCVLSNTGDKVMYFSSADESGGTLKISDGENEKTICENAFSGLLKAPVANGDFTQIYYISREDNGLYFYNGEKSILIDSFVMGLIDI